jgi:hypothetical protein
MLVYYKKYRSHNVHDILETSMSSKKCVHGFKKTFTSFLKKVRSLIWKCSRVRKLQLSIGCYQNGFARACRSPARSPSNPSSRSPRDDHPSPPHLTTTVAPCSPLYFSVPPSSESLLQHPFAFSSTHAWPSLLRLLEPRATMEDTSENPHLEEEDL